jgi:hypothetical protein
MNNKAADGFGERSVQIIHSTLRTMRSEAMREELTVNGRHGDRAAQFEPLLR